MFDASKNQSHRFTIAAPINLWFGKNGKAQNNAKKGHKWTALTMYKHFVFATRIIYY